MKNTTNHLMFAAMLLLVTMFGCTGNGPDAVAKKFLTAQENKDFKAMKDLSTKESLQMIGMIEALSGKDTSKTKGTAHTIKSTEVKDSTALVTFCCNEEGKDDKLHLKKTPEGWKVDMSKETLMGGANLKDMMNPDTIKKMSSGTDIDSSAKPAADTTQH